MDQDAFRQTYREINERACLFEKSILTNQLGCSRAERFCIAEREGVHCRSEAGHARCQRALDILRKQAHFTLRTLDTKAMMAHGKAIRIQVGGMRGIRALLEPNAPDPGQVSDVDGLLAVAEQRFGDLTQLPYSEVMPHIAAYQGRPTRRGRRRH
jgi:hypothetical protein